MSKVNRSISIEFSSDALSAIEQFFAARFQLYRWLIWHHSVVRQHLVLSRLIALIVGSDTNEAPSEVSAQIQELRHVSTPKHDVGKFTTFTDGYLLAVLAKLKDSLDTHACAAKQYREAPLSTTLETVRFLIRVFLLRSTRELVPLWKRPDEYHSFAGDVCTANRCGESGDVIAAFNGQLAASYDSLTRMASPECGAGTPRARKEYLFCKAIEDRLALALGKEVLVAYNSSFRAGPALEFGLFHPLAAEPIRVVHVSPDLAALTSSWSKLPHLWVFVRDLDVAQGLPATREIVTRELARFLTPG